MSRLFIFAIGGTGARVLRSMGNLLASGVKLNVDEIVPMIIDTDQQNADTQRCEKLLKDYRQIRNSITNLDNSFFHNRIVSLGDLARQGSDGGGGWGTNFTIRLNTTVGKTLSGYVAYDYIQDQETKAMLDLLYSKNNMNDSLTYGFLGSPNVGCIVLDDIVNTPEFQYFGSIVKETDRVFIISSIFGGTGAAGFPLLLNNFTPGVSPIKNQEILNNIPIGAVTVLPYFTLNNNEESRIDSTSFYTKSIAALNYYQNNLKRVNVLYYVGDSDQGESYENKEGGSSQCNNSNFIEVAAALSLEDFLSIPRENIVENDFREFAVENNVASLKFSDVGKITNQKTAKALCSYKLMNIFTPAISKSIGLNFLYDNNITEKFFTENFYSSWNSFFADHFEKWIIELSSNKRGLNVFGGTSTENNLTNFINGKEIPSEGLFKKTPLNKKDFISACSEIKSKLAEASERYVDMMHRASSELYDKKIKSVVE